MPSFVYQSVSTSGESRTGTISAVDRADAVRQLNSRGETATRVTLMDGDAGKKGGTATKTERRRKVTPVKRKPVAKRSGPRSSGLSTLRSSGRPSISRSELAAFVRELATAIEAGLPLMQSLKTVRRQASGRGLPVILDHLIERVEAGDPLHIAARDYGAPFDDMIVGMLRAADASGKMSEILHQLADLLERSLEVRREVMGATIYPMIVFLLLIGSVIVLVTVLVPKLIQPLEAQLQGGLPWPTQIVLGFANFFSSYWMFILAGIAMLVFGWKMWIAQPENRFRLDLASLRMPVLGPLLRDVAVARFTRTLGTLTSSGLPLLDSLRITRGTLGNEALGAAVDEVQDQVTSGKSLADPLERSGLFPPLLIQVVNMGERSGRLETMLLHAATAFDRQVNSSLKIFTKALPPVLVIFMAVPVVFVLAAILLPLLELQSSFTG